MSSASILLATGLAAPVAALLPVAAFARLPDDRALARIRGAFLSAITGVAVSFFALAAALRELLADPRPGALALGPFQADTAGLAFAAALALVTAASVVASRTRVDTTDPQSPHPADPSFLALVLVAQSAAIATLLGHAPWLRAAGWLGLPLALAALLSRWGGEHRRAALARLLAVPVLLGASQVAVEFRWLPDASIAGTPWVVWAGLVAVGTRLPVPGLHGWLAPLHAALPMSVSAFAAAAFVSTGTHTLLRLAHDFPLAVGARGPLLATIGAAAAVHGALLTADRRDARRLAAYVSLALAGLVPLGISSPNPQGLVGATLVGLGLTLAVPLALLGLGVPTRRLKTLDLDRLDSIGKRLPEATVLATIGLFACALLPPGLPQSEPWLVLVAALPAHPLATIAVSVALVVVGTSLAFRLQRLWSGRPRFRVDPLPPLGFRERWSLYPLAIAVVLLGAAPHVLVRSLEPAAVSLARAMFAP